MSVLCTDNTFIAPGANEPASEKVAEPIDEKPQPSKVQQILKLIDEMDMRRGWTPTRATNKNNFTIILTKP